MLEQTNNFKTVVSSFKIRDNAQHFQRLTSLLSISAFIKGGARDFDQIL